MHRQASKKSGSKLVREVRRIGRQVNGLVRPVLGNPGGRNGQQPLNTGDPPNTLDDIRARYARAPMAKESETFCLLRIIGNDLVPRHRKGQSRNNVAFILEHEPDLPGCAKRWILNRISDQDEEIAILSMLKEFGQEYHRIPFDLSAYAQQPWDVNILPDEALSFSGALAEVQSQELSSLSARVRRLKSNYAINNNGARNVALDHGRTVAKWVLPWDGNCFLTAQAWSSIQDGISEQPFLPYFVVPMARTIDNTLLLRSDYAPDPGEEPQIIFRRDAQERFNGQFPYGHRPKVELLWRLGVPGNWNSWKMGPFDLPRPTLSAEAGHFSTVGWVARLSSGYPEQEIGEQSIVHRGAARNEAIVRFLDGLDQRWIEAHLDRDALHFYDDAAISAAALDGAIRSDLYARASNALARGPYSVVHKTTLPPSSDPQDYWHPAPYWWPNPNSNNGLPYVWRDGHRLPGTDLYEAGSEQYDRTSLQRLFDDTTVLAIAWRVIGEQKFAEHAAKLVRTWFIDPSTRMRPHLRYAQVRRGHRNDEGSSAGIIETKDLYFFLDAVRLISRSGALDVGDTAVFREWIASYATWLTESPQGQHEIRRANNHATMYDLQIAAIAAYMGDHGTLTATLRRAQERFSRQFSADGSQPHELVRANTRHYCCFNLQGWLALSRVLRNGTGYDLSHHVTSDGRSLDLALEWFLRMCGETTWSYRDEGTFDRHRLGPIMADYHPRAGRLVDTGALEAEIGSIPSCLHPHYCIAPYWMFATKS